MRKFYNSLNEINILILDIGISEDYESHDFSKEVKYLSNLNKDFEFFSNLNINIDYKTNNSIKNKSFLTSITNKYDLILNVSFNENTKKILEDLVSKFHALLKPNGYAIMFYPTSLISVFSYLKYHNYFKEQFILSKDEIKTEESIEFCRKNKLLESNNSLLFDTPDFVTCSLMPITSDASEDRYQAVTFLLSNKISQHKYFRVYRDFEFVFEVEKSKFEELQIKGIMKGFKITILNKVPTLFINEYDDNNITSKGKTKNLETSINENYI